MKRGRQSVNCGACSRPRSPRTYPCTGSDGVAAVVQHRAPIRHYSAAWRCFLDHQRRRELRVGEALGVADDAGRLGEGEPASGCTPSRRARMAEVRPLVDDVDG